jgi:hypothetical protein
MLPLRKLLVVADLPVWVVAALHKRNLLLVVEVDTSGVQADIDWVQINGCDARSKRTTFRLAGVISRKRLLIILYIV